MPTNPIVNVVEVSVDKDLLVSTYSPKPIDLGGGDNFAAAVVEQAIAGIRRTSRREGGRVFLLSWEGTKIPRGAQVFGHTIVWTQHGQVTAKLAGSESKVEDIGTYDRLEEWGGPDRRSHKMLVYVSPAYHPSIVLTA